MSLVLMIGLAVITSVASIAYIGWAANMDSSFLALMQAALFLINMNAGGEFYEIPVAYASAEGFALAMAGVWTWAFAGLVAIFLLGTIAITLAYSYTRAMALGVLGEALERKKTSFLAMFKAGRTYWRASFWYALPFSILALIAFITLIPSDVAGFNYLVEETTPPLMLFDIARFFIMMIFVALAALTFFGEGVIVQGSNKPVRESTVMASLKWKSVLLGNAIAVVIALAVLGIDYLRGLATISLVNSAFFSIMVIEFSAAFDIIAIISFIFFLALIAAWRLWVAALAISLLREENQ